MPQSIQPNSLAVVKSPTEKNVMDILDSNSHAVVVFDLKGPPFVFSANEKFYQLFGSKSFESVLGIST